MKSACAILLLACSVFMGGCATQSKQPPVVEADPNYLLKPGDTISVSFDGPVGDDNIMPVRILQIDDRGAVTLSLIGAIQIAGLTTTQAAAKIHDTYVPKYFSELTVIVKKVESP